MLNLLMVTPTMAVSGMLSPAVLPMADSSEVAGAARGAASGAASGAAAAAAAAAVAEATTAESVAAATASGRLGARGAGAGAGSVLVVPAAALLIERESLPTRKSSSVWQMACAS